MERKRFLILIETDMHGNHRYGLLNPTTRLVDDDGEEYKPEMTKTQKFLHKLRVKNVGKLLALAGDDDIHYINIGDQVQGYKHPTDLVSSKRSDQFLIARGNMSFIAGIDNVKSIRCAVGTQAHDGHLGSEAQTLQQIYKEEYPDKDIETVWHGVVNINGVTVDYAHHGPPVGRRSWTKANSAWHYLRSEMKDELDSGNQPPDLYVRGHVHSQVEVSYTEFRRGKKYQSNLIVVPAMCGISAYARQSTRSIPRITNGCACIEVINGKIHDIYWWTVTSDLRKSETIA